MRPLSLSLTSDVFIRGVLGCNDAGRYEWERVGAGAPDSRSPCTPPHFFRQRVITLLDAGKALGETRNPAEVIPAFFEPK